MAQGQGPVEGHHQGALNYSATLLATDSGGAEEVLFKWQVSLGSGPPSILGCMAPTHVTGNMTVAGLGAGDATLWPRSADLEHVGGDVTVAGNAGESRTPS